jgi:hypothetical protein
MFRAGLVLALCSLPALAQRTDPSLVSDPASRRSVQTVRLDSVVVHATVSNPGEVEIRDIPKEPQIAIVLERDLLAAVQGNLDRERLERCNGENR